MRKIMLMLLILGIFIFPEIVFGQTAPVDLSSIPVDCSFTNVDASTALSELAKQTNVDIAIDPAVVGKITIQGKMTFGEAIDRICAITGALSSRVGEKSIIVTTPNPKGIYFSNISETEFIPANYLDAKQILALLANNPLSQYMAFDEKSNMISITAPRPIIDRLKAEIAKIDVEPLSMGFKISFLDNTKSELNDAGFQLALTNAKPNGNGVSTFTYQNTTVGFTNPFSAFQLFHYLAGNNVKILSQPTGVVNSGQTLELSFGEDLTILTVIVGGVGVPGGINTVKSGTQITIKPDFISPNKIRLEIKGDVSQPVAAFSSGNIVTKTTHRTFGTTRFLTDGETAFIGGLESHTENITKSKIPLLGDIPLIGGIFRSSHKEFLNQDITILITLYLIKPGEISPEMEKLIKESKKKIEEQKPAFEDK